MRGWARTAGKVSRIFLVALIIISVPVACAHRSISPQLESRRIVWPLPPAEPRIEYLFSVRTPGELGIRRAWASRLFSYLARGRRPVDMARPYAVTVGPKGRIAVADPDARCLHIYDPERSRYTRLLSVDKVGFISPLGVTIDSRGVLYVSDSVHRRIFRLDEKEKWLEPFGSDAELQRPTGLAYDADRELIYVVDSLAHRIVVYDISGRMVRTIGSRGELPGEFNYPVAIAIGPKGRVYVTDAMNFRVQIFDPEGNIVSTFGRAGSAPGEFDKAKGIAVNRDGHIFVAEALHDIIHVYDSEGRLLTVIGKSGTGPGEFWLPTGLHIDGQDRILVADSANKRIQFFRYLGQPTSGRGK
jgi:sugar lactone lactonase YvrE